MQNVSLVRYRLDLDGRKYIFPLLSFTQPEGLKGKGKTIMKGGSYLSVGSGCTLHL